MMRVRWMTTLLVLLCAAPALSAATLLDLRDPAGDDDGPGTYLYPTDPVYTPGSFDLTRFEVVDKGSQVELRISVGASLKDPWSMGTGFCLQMAQVYIDTDGLEGSGHALALPGMNAAFLPEDRWERCVVVSPQPASRVRTEVTDKAPDMAADVLVPVKVSPRGRTLVALVPKADLGSPEPGWGYQVLLASNEGFPNSSEVLSRRVNEYEGPHRFGGGDDWTGDPHFMDILCPPASGSAGEAELQHRILAAYRSGPEPSDNTLVQLPMVRKNSNPSTTLAAGTSLPRELPPPPAGGSSPFGLTWSGKIFTNWLYGNDNTTFSAYVAPFGEGGHNGTNSELELTVKATVSEYVEAGARIKNRYRKNYWSTYWDNNGETDPSTDTNEANQYMKLRGIWIRARGPEWIRPALDSVLIGSSDLGMFSTWTVGRIRYIDRDNAMGIFATGRVAPWLSYDLARISMPSRWAGPGYTTRGSGFDPTEGFHTRDFAWAAAFNLGPWERLGCRLVADWTIDKEGDPDDENPRDGVDTLERYECRVASLELSSLPLDFLELEGVFTYSDTAYDDRKDYIQDWVGVNSVIQKDTEDTALTLTASANDPFGVGLSFQAQYFDIGEDFQSLMASRREADVLITEGFEADDAGAAFDWGGWWGTSVQVPTIIVDNFETQFDETYAQNCIGWKGATGILSYGIGALDLTAEYTVIDYNTDMQGRDMTVYPTNGPPLGHEVYWGDSIYRWGDAAYREYQDRDTRIWLLKGTYAFEALRRFDLGFKVKSILDEDEVDRSTSLDDYSYDKMIYDLHVGCQVFDEIYLKVGTTIYDKEMDVYDPDQEERFAWSSEKNRIYGQLQYNLGGVKLGYSIENFQGQDLDPGSMEVEDDYDLWRSRAFLEVAF